MIEPIPLVAYEGLEEQAEAVHRDGYAYLPGVIDAGEVQRLRAAMDALEAIPESFDRVRTPEKGGFFNKSINNAFNRDPLFTGYLDRPRVIELAEALHGPDCHCIGMTAWLTGPGRPDQNLHADWQPLLVPEDLMEDPRLRIPVYITTAHYYLDDLYEELGPTAFVPGSHRAGRPPDGDTGYKGSPPKGIFCKAGDVVDLPQRGLAPGAPPTPAIRCVTCCRCTTRSASSPRSTRPTSTASGSIPTSSRGRRRGSFASWGTTNRATTIETGKWPVGVEGQAPESRPFRAG